MKILKNQIWHWISLMILLLFVGYWIGKYPEILSGNLWHIQTKTWFYLALLIPIIHQVYVLFCWRLELHYKYLSKLFGPNSFRYYKTGFFILFLSRFIILILLAISNKNTFILDQKIKYFIMIPISFIALYTFYSVKKYFGFDRAAGLDHFDKSLSKQPLVNKGIFKYTNNAMYQFAFLAVYLPGIILQSKAALLAAIFSHMYIWVHYYFTEKPDMKIIYSNKY